jgi:hypothetical protein
MCVVGTGAIANAEGLCEPYARDDGRARPNPAHFAHCALALVVFRDLVSTKRRGSTIYEPGTFAGAEGMHCDANLTRLISLVSRFFSSSELELIFDA